MMKKFMVLLVGLILFGGGSNVTAQNDVTVISVENEVLLADADRLGINIGAPDPFGAANYMKNVVANPGFEGGEFGTIFLV